MKIGVIAMSARPFHMGHWHLIETAVSECSEVQIFASKGDRARKGEITIEGSRMLKVWNELIIPALSETCRVHFVDVPVRSIYETLSEALYGADDFVIYSDPTDLDKNFPERSRKKYLGKLVDEGRLTTRSVDRAETAGVSGTLMRRFIAEGDKPEFMSRVPKNIDGERYWNMLSENHSLKTFISLVLK